MRGLRNFGVTISTLAPCNRPENSVSSAALATATEQLAPISAFRQSVDDSRASRLGMPAVLFEHEGAVLPDEL
jgi:uncharacterized protein (DUF1499 family)